MQAVEQFQIALHLDPSVPLGHYHLGFAYASLGRNTDAIGGVKELVACPSILALLYQLGHCLVEAGEWNSAVEHLKRATEIEPNDADASC